VKHLGVTGKMWTDHSDIRPTILALAGLKDDYAHQGIPIAGVINGLGEEGKGSALQRLAALYKQINAPVGQLSLDSIQFATRATLSTSAGDETYIKADAKIAGWAARRDALAAKMIVLLDSTAPSSSNSENGKSDSQNLAVQAQGLLDEVHAAAAS